MKNCRGGGLRAVSSKEQPNEVGKCLQRYLQPLGRGLTGGGQSPQDGIKALFGEPAPSQCGASLIDGKFD